MIIILLKVNCQWKPWSAWSQCNSECTPGGTTSRTRTVKFSAAHHGTPCNPVKCTLTDDVITENCNKEEKQCNREKPCPGK